MFGSNFERFLFAREFLASVESERSIRTENREFVNREIDHKAGLEV